MIIAPTFTMYSCGRPYSSTLGKAQDTEIFRNMDNFEKVPAGKQCVCYWVGVHQWYTANDKISLKEYKGGGRDAKVLQ